MTERINSIQNFLDSIKDIMKINNIFKDLKKHTRIKIDTYYYIAHLELNKNPRWSFRCSQYRNGCKVRLNLYSNSSNIDWGDIITHNHVPPGFKNDLRQGSKLSAEREKILHSLKVVQAEDVLDYNFSHTIYFYKYMLQIYK